MIPDCSYIPYRETGFFSELVCDYLDDKPQLSPFVTAAPILEEFSAFLKNKSKHIPNRTILTTCLLEQYEKSGILDNFARESISRLESEHCFTVTTGQQTGILLGPLYAPLKIISAINLCKQLKNRYPENTFVPVFWMATEDHDKEEIQSAYVNGKKYTWHTPQTGPVGRFSNEGMMDLLEEIQNDFPDFFAHDLQNVFKEAYQLATLAAATRYIVHALFGKYGVIVLDADDTRLKSQFSNIIINDILEGVSHKEVEHASKKLSESYSLQAQGREINFFYLTNSYRERIVKSAGGFETIDKEHQWTIETLRMEVEQNPERFSPNVIMRPVYQEIILPNIAYIGGGAEIAYWLPLKGIFHAYNIPFPALLLRNSAIIIDQVNSHRLKNAGLKIADIFKSLDELKKRKSLERFGEALHLDSIKIAMKPELEMLEKLAKEVSPELKEASQAFEKRIHHTIDAFSEKLIREAKKHNDIEVLRLNELFKHMYPEGSLQERKESILTFVLRHGLHVIDDLLSVCDPVHNRFVVLQY